MNKIVLVCNAGMSTGMMAKKMQALSDGKYIVKAYGETDYMDHLEDAVIVLVGPQIRHRIPDMKEELSIPVVGIKPQHYGLMDAKGVLAEVEKILEEE